MMKHNHKYYNYYFLSSDRNAVCLGVLIFLLVVLIIWFNVENSLLRMFSNPLITHYIGKFSWDSWKKFAARFGIQGNVVSDFCTMVLFSAVLDPGVDQQVMEALFEGQKCRDLLLGWMDYTM